MIAALQDAEAAVAAAAAPASQEAAPPARRIRRRNALHSQEILGDPKLRLNLQVVSVPKLRLGAPRRSPAGAASAPAARAASHTAGWSAASLPGKPTAASAVASWAAQGGDPGGGTTRAHDVGCRLGLAG